jgi:DNA-binding transcriptional regulator YiaG
MKGGMPDEQAWQAADQRSEVGAGDRQGEADPKTYRVHVPAHLDVRAIRTKLKMSQNAFASLRHLAIHEQALPAHHGRTGWGPTLIFR